MEFIWFTFSIRWIIWILHNLQCVSAAHAMPTGPPTWNDSNTIAVTSLFWCQLLGSFILHKSLQTLVCQALLLLQKKRCKPFYFCSTECIQRLKKEAVAAVSASVFWSTAHILSVCRVFLSVIPHPQNSWNQVFLVIPPLPLLSTCFFFYSLY